MDFEALPYLELTHDALRSWFNDKSRPTERPSWQYELGFNQEKNLFSP